MIKELPDSYCQGIYVDSGHVGLNVSEREQWWRVNLVWRMLSLQIGSMEISWGLYVVALWGGGYGVVPPAQSSEKNLRTPENAEDPWLCNDLSSTVFSASYIAVPFGLIIYFRNGMTVNSLYRRACCPINMIILVWHGPCDSLMMSFRVINVIAYILTHAITNLFRTNYSTSSIRQWNTEEVQESLYSTTQDL